MRKFISLILVNRKCPCPADNVRELAPVHEHYPHILMEQEAAQTLLGLMEQLDGWQRFRKLTLEEYLENRIPPAVPVLSYHKNS